MKHKNVLIMAGGTGGHVIPALALAAGLQEKHVTTEWLGTAAGIESRLVPEAGIKLHCLSVQGIRGKSLLTVLAAPYKILKSVIEAIRIIRILKPELVVGLGGYASGPGGLAAALLRLPLIIHEQNAVAGTTNRWLAKVATQILTAFPDVLPKSECIGNPIRSSIYDIPAPDKRFENRSAADPIRILVLGGSLGAQFLNTRMPSVFAKLSQQVSIEVWHQCGTKKIAETEAAYQGHSYKHALFGFLENMDEAFSWADLVVCRAGALTVSELAAAGVASMLVPFPYAIDDHQTKNAEWLSSEGAAVLLQERDFEEDAVVKMLLPLVSDRGQLVSMAKIARSKSPLNATDKFVGVCMESLNG